LDAILVRYAGQGFSPGHLADASDLLENRVGVGCQKQQPDSAVRRVLAPLDQPACLQLVENAHQRDGLDFQDIGEPALMDAFVLGQIGERLPLRTGQPEIARPLLETLAQQACNVMQEETQSWLVVRVQNRPR
jgi:hypothetical protein